MSTDPTLPDIPVSPDPITLDDGECERLAALVREQGWRGRAEAAEAKLAEVRAVLLEGGQGDATARCRAMAIVGTGETQERSDEKEAPQP